MSKFSLQLCVITQILLLRVAYNSKAKVSKVQLWEIILRATLQLIRFFLFQLIKHLNHSLQVAFYGITGYSLHIASRTAETIVSPAISKRIFTDRF
jgi:hypothetical protein